MKKLVLLIFLLGGQCLAASWHIPAYLPATADSMRWKLDSAGTTIDSGDYRTSVVSYDTTFSVSDNIPYLLTFYVWYPGSDSVASWSWSRYVYTETGYGPYSVNLTTLDTSGTDAKVGYSKVSIYDASGTGIARAELPDTGIMAFNLVSGSYTIRAYKPGYIFGSKSLTVSTAVSDTIEGYNIVVGSAGAATLCRINGIVWTAEGTPAKYATVKFSIPNPITDTCDNVTMIGGEFEAETDTLGMYIIDLVPTGCMPGTKKYTAWAEWFAEGGKTSYKTSEIKLSIPTDSTSYYLVIQ